MITTGSNGSFYWCPGTVEITSQMELLRPKFIKQVAENLKRWTLHSHWGYKRVEERSTFERESVESIFGESGFQPKGFPKGIVPHSLQLKRKWLLGHRLELCVPLSLGDTVNVSDITGKSKRWEMDQCCSELRGEGESAVHGIDVHFESCCSRWRELWQERAGVGSPSVLSEWVSRKGTQTSEDRSCKYGWNF